MSNSYIDDDEWPEFLQWMEEVNQHLRDTGSRMRTSNNVNARLTYLAGDEPEDYAATLMDGGWNADNY